MYHDFCCFRFSDLKIGKISKIINIQNSGSSVCNEFSNDLSKNYGFPCECSNIINDRLDPEVLFEKCANLSCFANGLLVKFFQLFIHISLGITCV